MVWIFFLNRKVSIPWVNIVIAISGSSLLFIPVLPSGFWFVVVFCGLFGVWLISVVIPKGPSQGRVVLVSSMVSCQTNQLFGCVFSGMVRLFVLWGPFWFTVVVTVPMFGAFLGTWLDRVGFSVKGPYRVDFMFIVVLVGRELMIM